MGSEMNCGLILTLQCGQLRILVNDGREGGEIYVLTELRSVRGRPLDVRSISAQTQRSHDMSFTFVTPIKSRGFARLFPRYALG
jgi:hypothetical protein